MYEPVTPNPNKLVMVTIFLTKHSTDEIGKLVKFGYTPNRSEYVRKAISNQLKSDCIYLCRTQLIKYEETEKESEQND